MTQFPQIDTLPDAIFWDWDGTIVDSYEFLNDVYNHVLVTLGFEPLGEGEYRQYFGKKPKNEIFEALFGNKKDDALRLYTQYSLENNHKIQPFEGIHDTLKLLQDKGVLMGIVTIKKKELVMKELNHTGLSSFFPIVIGAGDAVEEKPSAAPLKLATKKAKLDVNKQNIWYVGDTENDILCAQNAGFPFLFLKGHIDTPALLEKYNPFISFERYDNLRTFFEQITDLKSEGRYELS